MLPWLPAVLALATFAAPRQWTDAEICVQVERPERDWADRPAVRGASDPWRVLRAGLEQGDPPAAPLDVSAFLTYLPWTDPLPGGEEPLAVRVTAAPHPTSPDKSLVRVGARAAGGRDIDRAPVDLVVVVDVSPSMGSAFARFYPALHDTEVEFGRARWPWFRYDSTSRLELVRATLRELVGALGPHDRVAVVTYGHGARVLLPPSPGDPDAPLLARIDQLEVPKFENRVRGMEVAEEAMRATARPCGDWRFLVLSDGGASLGGSFDDGLDAISAHAEAGRTWSGVTIGRGLAPADALEGVVWLGYGAHGYADNPYEARRVFEAMLRGDRVVGRDVSLTVDFHAPARRLDGGPELAGLLRGGQHHAALYEVDAPPSALRATVRYAVGSPAPGEWTREGQLALGPEHVPATFASADRDLRMAWAVRAFALQAHRPDAPWEALFRGVDEARRPEFPVDTELLALVARAAAAHVQAEAQR